MVLARPAGSRYTQLARQLRGPRVAPKKMRESNSRQTRFVPCEHLDCFRMAWHLDFVFRYSMAWRASGVFTRCFSPPGEENADLYQQPHLECP